MNGFRSLALDMLAPDVADIDSPSAVRRARSGDEAAFGELVMEHEQRVLRTAWRMLGNPEDARDIAQDVFLRLHRHLRRIDPDRDPGAWLHRVTVNLCLTALRRRKRKPESPLGAHEIRTVSEGEHTEQDRLAEAADARRILASVLDVLSDRERAVVVLRDLEGFDVKAVARALGCRQVTVRAHLSRARLKLRTAVSERGGRG